jgi:hypothetical protein
MPYKLHIHPRRDGTFQISTQAEKPTAPRQYDWGIVSGYHGGINPMPGATGGFKTIRDALLAIRCLEFVRRKVGATGYEHADGFDAQRWWDLYHRVSGVTAKGRAEQNRMAKALGRKIIRAAGKAGRHNSTWVAA